MNKNRILILQRRIPHYRIPLFNELSNHFQELNLIYSEGSSNLNGTNFNFEQVKIIKLWKFYIQNINFWELHKYDYIILEFDLSYLSNYLILLFYRKKVIFWGQAVNNNKISNLFRILLANYVKAIIVYMPSKKYKLGKYLINKKKVFVARNSVCILNPLPPKNDSVKNSFLFVGSLYPGKKIPELILAFNKNINLVPHNIVLNIIGDGPDKLYCESLVRLHRLENRVIFKEHIFNEIELDEYYKRAIACVSPDSSGLSIINAFSKSVPFITRINARSGGELDNIINNFNGILYNGNIDELSQIMLNLINNPHITAKLSRNAFDFFIKNCTFDKMILGFLESINYLKDGK